MRDQGYTYNKHTAGTRTAPSFWRYWNSPARTPPEDATVDRTALHQIMAGLKPSHAQALLALAVHGGYHETAGALGVPYDTFRQRVRAARSAFLALWHEHEAPSRKWREDKRECRRAPSAQPASHADAVSALSVIREAFGGRTRAASADLSARSPPPIPAGTATGTCSTWPASCADTRSAATRLSSSTAPGRAAGDGSGGGTGLRKSPPP
jgi:hypothetical protein